MMASPAAVISTLDKNFEDHTRHQIALRLLPFLFVLYIVNYIDRTNLSYAVLGMSRDLGFNDRVFGLGVGMFFVGYVLMQIPGAMLVDRWSARKAIALCMVTWGFLTVLSALVRTPLQLYAIRFALGAAEAGFFPGVLAYLSHWFIRDDRAKSTSNFMAAIPLSSVIGAPFAGLLLGRHWFELQGWRWLFILEGLPAILCGAIAFFYLTDRPHQAKWLSQEQRDWLIGRLDSERNSVIQSKSPLQTLRSRFVVTLAVATFFSYFMYYSFLFHFPTMLKAQSGLSNQLIGFLGMLPFIVTFFAMQINAWHSDRTRERIWHASIPFFFGALGLLGLISNPSSTAFAVLLFALVSSATSYLPIFFAIPSERLSHADIPGAYGLINGVGSIAGFAGPYAFGYLRTRTGSYSLGLDIMLVCALLAAVLILSLRRPEPSAA